MPDNLSSISGNWCKNGFQNQFKMQWFILFLNFILVWERGEGGVEITGMSRMDECKHMCSMACMYRGQNTTFGTFSPPWVSVIELMHLQQASALWLTKSSVCLPFILMVVWMLLETGNRYIIPYASVFSVHYFEVLRHSLWLLVSTSRIAIYQLFNSWAHCCHFMNFCFLSYQQSCYSFRWEEEAKRIYAKDLKQDLVLCDRDWR